MDYLLCHITQGAGSVVPVLLAAKGYYSNTGIDLPIKQSSGGASPYLTPMVLLVANLWNFFLCKYLFFFLFFVFTFPPLLTPRHLPLTPGISATSIP